MLTNVYVDGFNFYYGAVKGTPYKWLDIRRYCELAFPKNEIAEIHYCTATVRDTAHDPQKSARQQTFIRALETTGVTVHYGSFLSTVVRLPLAKPRPGEPRTVEVIKTEEKGRGLVTRGGLSSCALRAPPEARTPNIGSAYGRATISASYPDPAVAGE